MDKLGDLFHLKKGSADAQLHEAVRTGDAKQVGKTLRRRSSAALIDSVDYDGRTPLHVACITGSAQSATMLLEAGASVDALDFDGRTPLMCASSKNSKLCCKALLDYGANVHVRQRGTMATALHFALGPARADKFEEVVRLLLRDSDVNATCEPGQKTPLMLAVENMHLKCAVHILSTRRVDANVVDDNGNTILFYAVEANLPALVRELVVVHNADTSVRNHAGMYPSDLATQLRHYDCQAALGDYAEANQDSLSQHVASDMHEAPRAAPQLYEGEGEEMMHDVCAWGYEMSWGEDDHADIDAPAPEPEADQQPEEEQGKGEGEGEDGEDEYEEPLSTVYEVDEDFGSRAVVPYTVTKRVRSIEAPTERVATPPPKPERYSGSRSNSSESLNLDAGSRRSSNATDMHAVAQKFANSRTSSQQSLNLECLAGDTPAAPVNDPRVGELEAEVRRLQDETRTEREACDAVLEQLQLSQAECIKLRGALEAEKAKASGDEEHAAEVEQLKQQLRHKEDECERLGDELQAIKQRLVAMEKEHAREVAALRESASARSSSHSSLAETPVSVKNRIGMFQQKADTTDTAHSPSPARQSRPGVLGKVHMFEQKAHSESPVKLSTQQVQAHKDEVQRIKADLADKQRDNDRLKGELAGALREKDESAATYEKKIAKLQLRIEELEGSSSSDQDSIKLIARLQSRIDELESAAPAPASDNTELIRENERLKAMVEELEASKKVHRIEADSVKARLAAFETKSTPTKTFAADSPSGVRGAISIFEKKASESRSTTPQKAVGARGSLTSYGGL